MFEPTEIGSAGRGETDGGRTGIVAPEPPAAPADARGLRARRCARAPLERAGGQPRQD